MAWFRPLVINTKDLVARQGAKREEEEREKQKNINYFARCHMEQ